MIRKNSQGRVVEFADESIPLPRRALGDAASPGAAVGSQEVDASSMSEGEVELQYEAVVLRAREDSRTVARIRMALLEVRVADLDASAKKAREAARQKFNSTQREAERICRLAVELAKVELESVMDCIRVDFHAAVAPINVEAVEILARQKAALDEVLSNLRQRRLSQLAMLAETRRLAAEEKKAILEYQVSLAKLEETAVSEKTAAEVQVAGDPRIHENTTNS